MFYPVSVGEVPGRSGTDDICTEKETDLPV